MKRNNKALISIFLVISLLVTGSFSAIAAPVISPDGHMTIDKVARTVTDDPRTFEVELSVNGTLPTPKPLDVILVIDSSGSMASTYEGKTLMWYAQKAAKDFADKILRDSIQNRVAVLEFFGPAYLGNLGGLYDDTNLLTLWQSGGRYYCGFTNNRSTVTSAIETIQTGWGTNIQAGFRRAKNLILGTDNEYNRTYIYARENTDKIVVLLTDGVAQSSWYNPAGPNETTVHNVHTIAAYEAGQELHSLAKVYTVGLFGGISNEQVKNIAKDTLIKAQNAGYYFTDSATDLDAIYDKIYENLNYYAANTVITDQIDDRFELVEGSIVTKIGDQVVTSPAASYDSSTRTITWSPGNLDTSATLTYRIKALDSFPGGNDIPTNEKATITYTDVNGTPNRTLDFPVPHVDVPGLIEITAEDKTIVIGDSVNLGDQVIVTGGTEPITFAWTWEGGSSTDENPTVSPRKDTQYSVTVTDKNGYSASASFWIYVKKGTVIIQKDVINVDNDPKVFSIHMNKAGSNSIWNVLAQDGGSYTITNLCPGTYTISETVPMNYELVSISGGTVSFTRDQILAGNATKTVTVTNKKIKVPYFWDTTSVQNVFKTRSSSSQ